MPATNQNLIDFFALTGNNPSVTNQQLTDLSDWLTDHIGLDAPADADDVVDYIYKTFREQVIAHKRAATTPVWG